MAAAAKKAAAPHAPSAAELSAAERLLGARKARDSLIDFTRFMQPDPEAPDDLSRSRYRVAPHHRLIAELFEEVVAGKRLRVAVSIPPQHGKSELISRNGPAWFMGKYPHRNFMFGTYNQDFAESFGGRVREIMRSAPYGQVFPEARLLQGSRSRDFMRTTRGGEMAFLGREGSGTGHPADLFVIDDPIKNRIEAQSPTIRDQVWGFFTSVVYSRLHATSAVFIVHTRWSDDDLIGRLTDPRNPHYDAEIAGQFTYINIPAILDDADVASALGLKVGDPLWGERFTLDHLDSARRLDPTNFSALYMGRPAPEEGDYFKRDMLTGYRPEDLPRNLRIYAASDHAVTLKQENDASVLGCVGVDERGIIWILPDLVWERMETDRTVEEWLAMMKRRRPELWWAEDDIIRKSIGPFLRTRMTEERIFCTIEPVRPTKDKKARARSAQGMASLKRFRFPKFAPWWPRAEYEMLHFPNSANDDFVDWLAHIGAGVEREIGASPEAPRGTRPLVSGTIAWIRRQTAMRESAARANRYGGM